MVCITIQRGIQAVKAFEPKLSAWTSKQTGASSEVKPNNCLSITLKVKCFLFLPCPPHCRTEEQTPGANSFWLPNLHPAELNLMQFGIVFLVWMWISGLYRSRCAVRAQLRLCEFYLPVRCVRIIKDKCDCLFITRTLSL